MILSCTDQAFIGLLRENQKSMFYYWGVGHVIFNLATGVGQSFLCQKEGLGDLFFYQPHFQRLQPPAHTLFDQSLSVMKILLKQHIKGKGL